MNEIYDEETLKGCLHSLIDSPLYKCLWPPAGFMVAPWSERSMRILDSPRTIELALNAADGLVFSPDELSDDDKQRESKGGRERE
jgi:hypothetical protein